MRILLLGDSHTFGSYGQALERLLTAAGHNVTRIGWVGAAAPHYLTGREKTLGMGGVGDFPSVKAQPFDIAIVSLGTNDAAGWSAEPAAKALKELIGSLTASRKVWVGPPAFSATAAAGYNPAFKAKDLNTRAAELYDAMKGAGIETVDPREATKAFVAPKDIHFGPAGGKAWAAFVAGRVVGRDGAALAPSRGDVNSGVLATLALLAIGFAVAKWIGRKGVE